MVACAALLLLVPVGIQAQEVDRATLDSLRARIEEVSRQQQEEVRRVTETRQAELQRLRASLDAERQRITEAQRALAEAERALSSAQRDAGGQPGAAVGRPTAITLQGFGSSSSSSSSSSTSSSDSSRPWTVSGQRITTTFPQFIATGSGLGGAELVSLNPSLARYFDVDAGVLIVAVPEGTPAAEAGLRPGDVIMEVRGTGVATVDAVSSAVAAFRTVEEAVVALEEGAALRQIQSAQPTPAREAGADREAQVNAYFQYLSMSGISGPIPLTIVREGRELEIVLEP